MALPPVLALALPLLVLDDTGAVFRAGTGASGQGAVPPVPACHADAGAVLALSVFLASVAGVARGR